MRAFRGAPGAGWPREDARRYTSTTFGQERVCHAKQGRAAYRRNGYRVNYHVEKQSELEYGSSKFRIAVEATPEEIAEMEELERAEKK